MPEEATFTVGPKNDVTDSREKPDVNADEEAGFVHGADLGAAHPDNEVGPIDDSPDVPTPEFHDESLPTDGELDELIADVDTDVPVTDNDDENTFTPIPIPDLGGGA